MTDNKMPSAEEILAAQQERVQAVLETMLEDSREQLANVICRLVLPDRHTPSDDDPIWEKVDELITEAEPQFSDLLEALAVNGFVLVPSPANVASMTMFDLLLDAVEDPEIREARREDIHRIVAAGEIVQNQNPN